MRLTEMKFDGPTPIDGYGPGFFRVASEVYHGPLLVLPGRVEGWKGLGDWAPIFAAQDQIDVLFLGMGAQIAALPAVDRALFDTAGIGVEIMATPAACRTYNVLLAEGRRIAAALMPV